MRIKICYGNIKIVLTDSSQDPSLLSTARHVQYDDLVDKRIEKLLKLVAEFDNEEKIK